VKLIMINSLPTAKIFGEKVDAWWYQKNGFDVKFWDISPLFWNQKELESYYGGAADYRYIGPNHRVFSSSLEVVNALGLAGRDTVVWHLAWNLNKIAHAEEWLLNAIVDSKIPFFIKQFETDPVWEGLTGWKQSYRLKRARRCFADREPAGFIGSGRVLRERVHKAFGNMEFISIPSPKVIWGELKSPATAPYAVFVDENIEYAPDAKMLGFSVSNDLHGYFSRMNDLFSLVEDTLGCPVVIAASGKYHYTEDRFDGRELLYSKTFALIQHSALVIGHCSGALDQAIVNNKPILQVSDQSFGKEIRENIDLSTKFTGITSIQNDDLKTIRTYIKHPKFDEEKATEVEAMYFREPGVQGDYREIIKDAFLSV